MNLKVFYIATICLSLFTQLPCQAFFEKDLHLLTMKTAWPTTQSTPFVKIVTDLSG